MSVMFRRKRSVLRSIINNNEIKGGAFTWSAFLSGSVLSAIPGIVLQLILVPIIVAVLQKAKLIPDDQ